MIKMAGKNTMFKGFGFFFLFLWKYHTLHICTFASENSNEVLCLTMQPCTLVVYFSTRDGTVSQKLQFPDLCNHIFMWTSDLPIIFIHQTRCATSLSSSARFCMSQADLIYIFFCLVMENDSITAK